MSKDNDDKFHTEEPELEFSLEDILAEYGQESQKEPDARTPIPLDQYRDREEPEPADPTLQNLSLRNPRHRNPQPPPAAVALRRSLSRRGTRRRPEIPSPSRLPRKGRSRLRPRPRRRRKSFPSRAGRRKDCWAGSES